MADAEQPGPPPPRQNPGRRRALSIGFGVLAAPVIGAAAYQSIRSASGGTDVRSNLTLVAPAAASGGWGAFQREMQQAMRAHSLVGNVQVINVPGAGGTIAIGNVAQQNRPNMLMVGGGEAIQALLNGTAQATAGGFADMLPQVRAGRLRGLGIVAPEPLDGVDIPALPDFGYDVTLTNWRAMFAPPITTDEEIAELEVLIEETTATPEWKDAAERYYWREVPLGHDDLVEYIASETERIRGLFEEIRG